ncbi:hypothetical protein BFX40_10110 [Mesorhizobium sp. SEMIA 3007]|nr:hypothetical protein BFX40_10110 [Mesorhizobium sp. SEMIA 3007]
MKLLLQCFSSPAVLRSAPNSQQFEAMFEVCDEFESYGYRRLGAALRQQGVVVNHKKIRCQMHEHGRRPKMRRRFIESRGRSIRIWPEMFSRTVQTISGWATSPMVRLVPDGPGCI